MTANVFQAILLVSTLSLFCAAFCPALLWVLTTPITKQA